MDFEIKSSLVPNDGLDATINWTRLEDLTKFNASLDRETSNLTVDPGVLNNASITTSPFIVDTDVIHVSPAKHQTMANTSPSAPPTPESTLLQSIEQYHQAGQSLHPSFLRYEHRRSLSAPPESHRTQGHGHHEPQPRFTRGTTPIDQRYVQRLKRSAKAKHDRFHPYSTPHEQDRYELLRTQTQTIPLQAATSTPMLPPTQMMPRFPPQVINPQTFAPASYTYAPLSPLPEEQGFNNLGPGTPVAEEAHMSSPWAVDQLLNSNQITSEAGDQSKSVVIPLTVEELRCMIFEAVQNAITSLHQTQPKGPVECSDIQSADQNSDTADMLEQLPEAA